MPIFMFQAQQVLQGTVAKFVVSGKDLPTVKALLDQAKIATPGIPYKPFVLVDRPENPPQVLCIEIAGPVLSPAHVQGGQPTANPQGQPGHPPDNKPRDPRSGFQDINHHELAPMEDSVYGDSQDGTYADLMQSGGDMQEIPRRQ